MRSPARNAAKNIGGVFLAQVGDGILRFFISILIARFFLVEEYGFLNFAYALTSYFLLFSDFGLQQILVRNISQNRQRNLYLYYNASLIRIFLALAIIILLGGGIWLFSGYEAYKIIIVELVLLLLLQNALNPSSIYDSFGYSRYDAALKFLATFLYALGVSVVLLILKVKNLPLVVLISVSAQFLYVFAAIFIFHKKISPLPIKFDFSAVKKLLAEGRIIVWARLMAQIYTNMDLIMINFLKGDRETGYYAIAYKLLFAAVALNAAMYRVFLPLIAELKDDFTALARRLKIIGKALAFASLPIAVMGIVFADKIVLLFYTSKYAPSILALRILLIYVALVGIGAIYGSTLFSIGRSKTYTLAITIGAISNIVLNFLLIPKYSFIGACVATVLSQIIVVSYTYIVMRRVVRFALIKNIFIFFALSVISSLVGYAIAISGLNFLFAIGLSGLFYLLLCFLSGAIKKSDFEKVGLNWLVGWIKN